MRLTRRDFAALSGAALAAPLISPGAAGASETIRSHGSSLLGDLKYGADFTHFASVNPDAPKGGVARLATSAGFDSFNPFIVKGNPPIWARRVFDTLFAPSLEEGSTDYGLIAEWIERPKDFSHVDFRVRDEAHRFAIGAHRAKRSRAITASPLDEIPGIGPARKRALLLHFGTAGKVRAAALDDLKRAPGISEGVAQQIYDFYHAGG